nr:unnamed protein product [Callosobruchus analis]
MASRTSSVPQSDSLYSVSSGGSSISSTSCSSDGSKGGMCCNGHCLGGAYPRQPATGAIRRSQQHAMKVRLQDYCRPTSTGDRPHVNRLPPIREMPGQSPMHNVPPASTRIRYTASVLLLPISSPSYDNSYKNYLNIVNAIKSFLRKHFHLMKLEP